MTQSEFLRRDREPGSAVYGAPRRWRRVHVDGVLLVLLILVMGFGIVVLYSASGHNTAYLERQIVFMAGGLLLMFCVAQVPLRYLEYWAAAPYIIGLLLLTAVFFVGDGAKGAQRWLDLGFLRFQPSEILRIAVPLMLSSFLGQRLLPPEARHVLLALALILVPGVLVAEQPDLGTALLVMSAGFFVLFLAGLRKRWMVGAIVIVISIAPLFWWYLLHDYQRNRILTLIDPQADKLGAGWNIIQSTTAIGSGGWSGKGWFQGTQSQLDFLPEGHTDFIIAVLGEEFGLIGVLMLLTLYMLIVLRGVMISLEAQTMFGRLLAGSITLTFFVYVFVNMGMVSGLLPVVGVPLPLVSYGGTSIMTLMIGFGMLMAVSTEKQRMKA